MSQSEIELSSDETARSVPLLAKLREFAKSPGNKWLPDRLFCLRIPDLNRVRSRSGEEVPIVAESDQLHRRWKPSQSFESRVEQQMGQRAALRLLSPIIVLRRPHNRSADSFASGLDRAAINGGRVR